MSNDEDRWALRAELQARKEEIATLRGVVAALRTQRKSKKAPARRVTIRSVVVAAGFGALVGFALAIVLALWLYGYRGAV
jgi:hypothetical protein